MIIYPEDSHHRCDPESPNVIVLARLCLRELGKNAYRSSTEIGPFGQPH